ncbi:hypothetical protein ACFLWU_02405 [Chloroflexota bacterium]
MAERKYEKYIVTELKTPEEITKMAAEYATRARRILWLDDDVVEGAFQINTAWYFKATDKPIVLPHTHDCDEVIAFFSGDPQNPRELGGEIEFWMEDEKYLITKSCLIFIPKGIKHCPLQVNRVDRPMFHFSTVTHGKYVMEDVASE